MGTAAVGARGSGGGSASALEQEMTRHYECDAPLQHGLLAAEMVTKEVTHKRFLSKDEDRIERIDGFGIVFGHTG